MSLKSVGNQYQDKKSQKFHCAIEFGVGEEKRIENESL